ncbi:MAG: copper chaperone CopZ [Christensenellales bacterium]|jgi:copper chaperone|nr:copper chaperone CopZ [Clostridiales bacterium]HHT08502.1 copper chaperone CopZ [Clostridiales bacterium]
MTDTLKVAGMSCAHCVKAVTDALMKLAGVTKVDIQLAEGLVQVDYDPSAVTLAQLTEAIEDQGYDVG